MSGEGALITGAIALKSEEAVPRTGAFALRPVTAGLRARAVTLRAAIQLNTYLGREGGA